MGNTICVKFNKVDSCWTLADIMHIQRRMKRRAFRNLRKATFTQMNEVGYGYAFLTTEQISSVKNDYLMVDSKGNIY